MTTPPITPESSGTSTRPYLIRALHDWCSDNGFTPYIAVFVDAGVQVPTEHVKNNEIVLNVSFGATSALKLGNEFIEFKARFGGTSRDVVVPIDHVIAIYARENGQGMAFPVPGNAAPAAAGPEAAADAPPRAQRPALTEVPSLREPVQDDAFPADTEPPPEPPSGGRPSLKRIK